ncbi:unnamed protein product [Trichogramma brassicae]|uniref:Uncharacterized protein n=1 Tax=Trichogramma brassicae TaxID=86971 RepID=A0A6H5J360_9HYME|nr:unnamed protein product [Trichogramma brassicae]
MPANPTTPPPPHTQPPPPRLSRPSPQTPRPPDSNQHRRPRPQPAHTRPPRPGAHPTPHAAHQPRPTQTQAPPPRPPPRPASPDPREPNSPTVNPRTNPTTTPAPPPRNHGGAEDAGAKPDTPRPATTQGKASTIRASKRQQPQPPPPPQPEIDPPSTPKDTTDPEGLGPAHARGGPGPQDRARHDPPSQKPPPTRRTPPRPNTPLHPPPRLTKQQRPTPRGPGNSASPYGGETRPPHAKPRATHPAPAARVASSFDNDLETLRSVLNNRHTSPKRWQPNFTRCDVNALRSSLNDRLSDAFSLSGADGPSDVLDAVSTAILSELDSFSPVISKPFRRPPAPWMTDALRSEWRQRDRLFQRARRLASADLMTRYRTMRRELRGRMFHRTCRSPKDFLFLLLLSEWLSRIAYTVSYDIFDQKKMAPTNSTCEIFSSFLKRHRRARMTRPYSKTIIKNDAGIKRSSCESDSDCNDRRSSSSDDADRERPGSDHSSASATTKYLAKPSAFRLGLGVYFNALVRESLARDVHKSEIC